MKSHCTEILTRRLVLALFNYLSVMALVAVKKSSTYKILHEISRFNFDSSPPISMTFNRHTVHLQQYFTYIYAHTQSCILLCQTTVNVMGGVVLKFLHLYTLLVSVLKLSYMLHTYSLLKMPKLWYTQNSSINVDDFVCYTWWGFLVWLVDLLVCFFFFYFNWKDVCKNFNCH